MEPARLHADTSVAASISGALYVGGSGTGMLNLTNGAAVTTGSSYIGSYSGSAGTATVTGAGSVLTANTSLSVGESGYGTLNVSNGGTVTAQDV